MSLKMSRASFTYLVCAMLVHAGVDAGSFYWPEWGRCPDVEPQKPFDLQSFQGQLYLQAGYNIEDLTPAINCASVRFNLATNSGQEFYQFEGSGETNEKLRKLIPLNGTASLANSTGDVVGLFRAVFTDDIQSTILPLWIFTDYSHYSIAYTCTNVVGFLHTSSIWIASFEQNLTKESNEEFMKTVESVLKSKNIAPSKLIPYNPGDCTIH